MYGRRCCIYDASEWHQRQLHSCSLTQFSSDFDLFGPAAAAPKCMGILPWPKIADFCTLWRPVKRKRGQTGGLSAFPVTNVTKPFQYSRWLQRAGFSIPMNPTYPLSGGAWTVASVARALNNMHTVLVLFNFLRQHPASK